ncbi:MAG TPA: hypothetical protein VGO43_03815 [Pyrinomonadaceae bacterium]|jgi:hypothetical protein|nr:hypothetical protein [Pyrinomonadaceae bacterium]
MLRHRRKIVILAIVFSIFRLGLSFGTNPSLEMNIDEERSWQIAAHHVAGRGYVFFDPYVNDYIPTALHASTPGFIYECLIRAGISKEAWVVAIYALIATALGLSIYFFYRLTLFFFEEDYSLAATVVYCMLPSSLFWVSRIFYYENLVMPLLVITAYLLIQSLKQGAKPAAAVMIPVLAIVSISLRNQAAFSFCLMLAAFAVIALMRRRGSLMIPVAVAAMGVVGISIPALIKNHELFGAYILSNQSGYEMLQGHNPLAKGGWNGSWRDPGDPLYDYAHQNIADLDGMDEYEESKARQSLAMSFIREQPLADLRLEIKKMALFFAPFDFPGLTPPMFDVLLLVIYVPFLLMVVLKVWRREISGEDIIMFAPIVGSIALTILFFMGPRWRYYAEPFMIVYAVLCIKNVSRLFSLEPTNAGVHEAA